MLTARIISILGDDRYYNKKSSETQRSKGATKNPGYFFNPFRTLLQSSKRQFG